MQQINWIKPMMDKRLLSVIIAMVLTGCDGISTENGIALEKTKGDRVEKVSGLSKKLTVSAGLANQSLSSTTRNAADTENFSTIDTKTTESTGLEQLENEALYGQDPKARIGAIKTLLEKADSESAAPVVEQALNDSDSEVRKETLALIYKKRVPVPVDVIHNVAVNDTSDQVRGMAWVYISDRGGPDLQEYLMVALNDPNPDIRRDAQRRLDRFEKTGR